MGCCTGYVRFLAFRSGLADELRQAGTRYPHVSSVTATARNAWSLASMMGLGTVHACPDK
jgi:hypothetical protein